LKDAYRLSEQGLEMERTIVQSDYGFKSRDRGSEKSYKPALFGARSFLKSISDEEMKSSARNRIPKAQRLNVTDMIGGSALAAIKEKKYDN
jgi:hypothetical protein